MTTKKKMEAKLKRFRGKILEESRRRALLRDSENGPEVLSAAASGEDTGAALTPSGAGGRTQP